MEEVEVLSFPSRGIIVALVLVTACSKVVTPGAGCVPSRLSRLEQGRFDDLPMFPRSEAVGPRSEKQGVVAQSFTAKGATPAQVLHYYEEALEEWTVLEAPHRVGSVDYRGSWAKDGYTLLVSSGPARGLDERYETVAQYSLTLSPT